MKFGKGVALSFKDVKFEGYNVLGENVSFTGELGYGSYIGSSSCINAKIGRYCCIAQNVRTVVGTHPTRNFVSIHPAFFLQESKRDLVMWTKINLKKSFMLLIMFIM